MRFLGNNWMSWTSPLQDPQAKKFQAHRSLYDQLEAEKGFRHQSFQTSIAECGDEQQKGLEV
jgi:hypothetical protein